jgi:glucuronate isomerase
MGYTGDEFLLPTKWAQVLYHEYAESMPILDYHCHLSPRIIAEDAVFRSITQLWLEGDHYKWRAMRANGIDEKYITGPADDVEKFEKWAATVPYALRNPLYDWVHLELKRYFGITDKLLSGATAAEIYAACNERVSDRSSSARNLLKRMNVKAVCTTDDPADDLCYHTQLVQQKFEILVLPTFRPDKALAVHDPAAYNRYLDTLSNASGIAISSLGHLLEALDKRHAYFHDHGCRSADHAMETVPAEKFTAQEAETAFAAVRSGKPLDDARAAKLRSALLLELCRMNHRRGWAQQLHLGVLRNAGSRLFARLGPDVGADCIGDFQQAIPLCRFLDTLDAAGQLTKTILYNINPGDNEAFASIANTFQDGPVPGKLQDRKSVV